MRKTTIAFGIVSLIIFSGLVVFFTTKAEVARAYTSHQPILIEGNSDFTSANGVTGGSGTPVDPYVIEDWDINASSAHGIHIGNTSVHFVIRDSYMHDGSSSKYGIHLFNVSNAEINDNEISFNQIGIFSRYSDNLVIRRNTVSNSSAGIYLFYTTDSLVAGNFGQYMGLQALRLWNSSMNIIENNVLRFNSLGLVMESYSSLNTVLNNEITNNTVGISISSYDSSDNNTIAFNKLTNNSQDGVRISQSYNNTVYNNAFINNNNNAFDGTGGLNRWNESIPTGGNYWDDYSGIDGNLDGFGDTPYTISGSGSDYLPLMTLPADTIPPAAILDLAPANPTGDSITLSWTAPGDDGTSGDATSYEIRYSTSGEIMDANWNSATLYSQSWIPLSAGSTESKVITGLKSGTQYWFAIKTRDEIPNLSYLSNSPTGTTIAITDTTPPTIIDVQVSPSSQDAGGSVNISSNITDDFLLFGVWINIVSPNGTILGNYSMDYDTTDGRYYFNSTYSQSGLYAFNIWANDSSGNWNSTSGSFEIKEIEDNKRTFLEDFWWIVIIVILIVVVVTALILWKRKKTNESTQLESPHKPQEPPI